MIKRILAAAIFLWLAVECSAAEKTIKIQTTLPWLESMARFIVGATAEINSISWWTDAGTLRSPRRIARDMPTIALDPRDAVSFGFKNGGVSLLYENLPVSDGSKGEIPFDPSILPFLSQRMLIVLSRLLPDNYPFFQRKLAEFQSRLESTLEVGRSLIGDVHILDLTGAISPWIRAADDGAVRPPEDLWAAWSDGKRTEELVKVIEEANKRTWWILTDAWTPAPVRARTQSMAMSIVISPPPRDYAFFSYLHDIYLEIWAASTAQ
ncbi:MAG: hypothetical protein LBI74_01995 [Synergistaceae bacterium]|jgi:hypothetical protein|nr:hypothetical protein [Synergistaceae bacterium]